MPDPLRMALNPACEELAKINGLVVHAPDGHEFPIVLNAQTCAVDLLNNRVTLGFSDQQDEYVVSIRRHAFWKIPAVAKSIDLAIRNGSLEPGGQSFDLDGYLDLESN